MIVYRYRGLDDEIFPHHVTHILVNDNVTTIKKFVFEHHYHRSDSTIDCHTDSK